MKKTFVKDMSLGEEICTPLAVLEKRVSRFTARNGQSGQALFLTLGDASGRIPAVAWEGAESLGESIQLEQIMLVTGKVQEYKGAPQILLEQVVPVPLSQIRREDFLAASVVDSEIMWRRLSSVMESIENPHLAKLLKRLFTPAVRESFCLAPAGREVHHAYAGGLLEHTLEVVAYAQAMLAEQGLFLNRDLLLTGAIVHDIGKIEEYDLRSLSFQSTDRGKLLGHLIIGTGMVGKIAREMGDFPPALLAELEHMIVAHHGVREWGSPEEPKTIDAMALHLADLASGRLGQFSRIIADQRGAGNRWSSYNRFLERSILLPEED